MARRLASRAAAVIAGILLVLVPTVFSVFPSWAEWDVLLKVLVLLLWVGAAAVGIWSSALQSERIEDPVASGRRRRREARVAAGETILQALLRPGRAGLPEHCEIRLFLPDASGRFLSPEFESTGAAPSESWEIGKGVTGAAFASNSYVRAHGDAVHDATHGLTPEQQARYRDLSVVVATPVLNARLAPIGVLTVSSEADDLSLLSAEMAAAHAQLAAAAARVVIDILRGGHD